MKKRKKITQEIVKCSTGADCSSAPEVPIHNSVKQIKRPCSLYGPTYKIRTPVYDRPFYVTINYMNDKVWEIFINSENIGTFAWTSALTIAWSAVFQNVTDYQFLVDKMLTTIDPKGGHWAHEKFHPSVVAEIGYIIDSKIKGVELCKSDRNVQSEETPTGGKCPECKEMALVKKDGCDTCQKCGYSKCA